MDVDPFPGCHKRPQWKADNYCAIWYLRFDFGAPMRRDRIYILLIRTELMGKMAGQDFPAFATELANKLQLESMFDWHLGFWNPASLLCKPHWTPFCQCQLDACIIAQAFLSKPREDLLLPDDHWRNEKNKRDRMSLKRRRKDTEKVKQNTKKKQNKWIAHHKAWAKKNKVISLDYELILNRFSFLYLAIPSSHS